MDHQLPQSRRPDQTQSSRLDSSLNQLNQSESNLFSQNSNDFSAGLRQSSSLAPHSSRRRASAFSPHLRGSGSRGRRATTPADMAVEIGSSRTGYTRTGRISKAKKGLPVHHCHCGKSYTRAEHLRRHQKNHSDQSLTCDWPDCQKVFHRDDLLQRHRERHNETQKDSPSRDESVSSHGSTGDSDPAIGAPATTLAPYQTLQVPAVSTSLYHEPISTSEPEQNVDISSSNNKIRQFGGAPSFAHSQIPVPISYDGISGLHPANILPSQWIASPQHSTSSCYTSPGHDYNTACITQPYLPTALRTRASSVASIPEPWQNLPNDCKSPISATSTSIPFEWPDPTKSPTLQEMGLPLGIDPALTVPTGGFGAPMESFSNLGVMFPLIKTYEERDADERKMLFAADSFGSPSDSLKLSQYMENYWQHFHPSFPMIHKNNFLSEPLAPLLHAAMLSIGAQFSPDADAKAKSRSMHELCVKVLSMREHDFTLPSRICDMQAIVLVEMMSQYRGRRLTPRFTSQFLEIYHFLSQDGETTSTRTLEDLTSRALSNTDDRSRETQWKEWVHTAGKQRLLASCFILEAQQSILLQRKLETTVTSGFDIPMPAPVALWNANSASEWLLQLQLHKDLSQCNYVYEVASGLGMAGFMTPLDTFQSFLFISAYHNSDINTIEADLPAFSGIINPSPQAQLYALTAQLVKATPVRELLATSGETWVFSEKVASFQEFHSYKRTLRGWASHFWSSRPTAQSTATEEFNSLPAYSKIRNAIGLALRICQLALDSFPGGGVSATPGTELGIYFAVLVLWATTSASTTRVRRSQALTNTKTQQGSKRNTPSSSRVPSPQPHPNPAIGITTSRNPQASIKLSTLQHDVNEFIRSLTPTTALAAELSALIDCSTSQTASTNKFVAGDGAPNTPPVLARWQHGAEALLRLSRARLRSGETRMPGELLDGMTGVLGTLATRGWNEDWF